MDMTQDAPSQASQGLPAAAEPVARAPSPPGGKEDVLKCGSPPPTDDGKVLRCTFEGCKAKEGDRVFIGKGARSAHKRHMDTHVRPYKCPKIKCPRNKNGFSRKDNLNIHLKTHDARAGAKSPEDGALRHLERRAASLSPEERLRRIDHVALLDTTQLLVTVAKKLIERLGTAQLDNDFLDPDMEIDSCTAESDIAPAGESTLSPPLSGSE